MIRIILSTLLIATFAGHAFGQKLSDHDQLVLDGYCYAFDKTASAFVTSFELLQLKEAQIRKRPFKKNGMNGQGYSSNKERRADLDELSKEKEKLVEEFCKEAFKSFDQMAPIMPPMPRSIEVGTIGTIGAIRYDALMGNKDLYQYRYRDLYFGGVSSRATQSWRIVVIKNAKKLKENSVFRVVGSEERRVSRATRSKTTVPVVEMIQFAWDLEELDHSKKIKSQTEKHIKKRSSVIARKFKFKLQKPAKKDKSTIEN